MAEDIATLAVQIDTSSAKAARADLDQLTATGAKTEQSMRGISNAANPAGQSVGRFSAEVAKLKASIDPTFAALQKYDSEMALYSKALSEGAIGQQRYNQLITQSKLAYEQASQGIVAASGAQRQGFIILGEQVRQIGTSYAVGIPPMQIFAQQAGQTLQAIQLTLGGASRFAAFMTGPWGIAIVAGASLLVPLIGNLLDTKKAAEGVEFASYKLSDAQSALGSIFDLTTLKVKNQTEALVALARAQALAGQVQAAAQQAQARKDLGGLAAPQFQIGGGPGGGLFIGRATNPATQVANQFLGGIGLSEDDARKFGLTADQLIDKLGKLQKSGKITADQFNSTAKAITDFDLAAANQKVFEDMEKAINGDKNALKEFQNEGAKHKQRMSEIERATREAIKAAKDYNDSLQESTAKLGLDEDALKRREAMLASHAALTAALNAPTQKERVELEALSKAILANADAWVKANDAIQRHKELEEALTDALPKLGDAISKALGDTLAHDAQLAADKTEILNQSLQDLIRNLQQVGGFGSVLGGLLGIVSGNIGAIGGPFGDLLNIVTGTHVDEKTGKIIADRLGDTLTKIFGGPNSPFAQTLTTALQGAGIGTSAASAVGLNKTGAEQIGSTIGGIAGQYAGKALLSFLGSAAGPVGSVLGGILGGLAGSLFHSASYGYAGSSGAGGNDSQSQQAAKQLGDSVQSGLEAIAQQLGLTLGSYSTSIGVTDGKYRYSTTGRTGELKSGYSDVVVTGTGDAGAQAAITGAIRDAIKDGALQGLSETEKAFLLKAGDLNAALNEVLDFHQTLDAVSASISPFKASLDALQKTFADQAKVYQELGATTEQLTQLQQYQQQQLQQLVSQASSQYLSVFGTTAQQTAAAKAQISATLTPLGYGNVDTVAEYTKLVNATDPLKDPELYGALMSLVDAFSQLKDAADHAAQAAAAKKLAEDQAIATAKNNLAQAYDRESSALKDTISAAGDAVKTLSDFRDSLIGTSRAGANVNQLLAKLMSVGGLAKAGDLTAAGQLPDAAQAYLDAAKASAGSYTQYQRAVATVLQYTGGAINAAEAQKTNAQKQLDAMTQQVGKLIDINQSVLSVKDAIDKLNALLAPGGGSGSGTGAGGGRGNRPGRGGGWGNRQYFGADPQEVIDRLGKLEQHAASTAQLTAQLLKHWKNLSPDGISLAVSGNPDAPVYTDIAP